MIIARTGEELVALVVDAVEDVIETPDDVQAPSGTSELADRMLGICRTAEGLVFVLDIETLLPETEISPASAASGGGE